MNGRKTHGPKVQSKRNVKRKTRPQWDDSINDVGAMKLNRSELEKRTKLYSAKHMERIRNEIRAGQQKEKKIQEAVYSSPFTAHNQSIIKMHSPDAKSKLRDLLNETDRKMAEAKDLFGDNGFKYRVIPNVTSAPSYKHSPTTLVKTAVKESPSPAAALNDTHRLGMRTVEKSPPQISSVIDLSRLQLILDAEKENLLRTTQNTLLNSRTDSFIKTDKVNKVLHFNEDGNSVKMEERTKSRVCIQEESAVPVSAGNQVTNCNQATNNHRATNSNQATSQQGKKGKQMRSKVVMSGDTGEHSSPSWSPQPVDQKSRIVVRSSSLEKKRLSSSSDRGSTPPPRLVQTSSESLVSPSRIKKQQQLERSKKRQDTGTSTGASQDGGSSANTSTDSHTVLQEPGIVPPGDTEQHDDDIAPGVIAPSVAADVVAGAMITRDVETRDLGTRDLGTRVVETRDVVSAATSPFFPLSPPTEKKETATSPVRSGGSCSPVRCQIRELEENGVSDKREVSAPLPITRGTKDRPYTDEELKERLEQLIVGGNYPFMKIEQKSYAIPENAEGNRVVWVQSSHQDIGERDEQSMKFVDTSPLKGAALDLELKLLRYQKQIGATSSKKTEMSGFTGYTALLLQSVSTMIGYLTEQECSSDTERAMRDEIIDTMGALQTTVETLSTELLDCRKDLSATKQKVQTLEHEYSSTLSFLVENCVLKDPSISTPKVAPAPKPDQISPYSETSDLMKFTPRSDLISFTPSAEQGTHSTPTQNSAPLKSPPTQDTAAPLPEDSTPDQAVEEVPPLPETSIDYLRNLEKKAEALRNDIDAKISKVMDSSRVSEQSMLSSHFGNLSDVTSLTEDGLDLSQDLDSLIERLKQMNAQTLASTSLTLGVGSPTRPADEGEVSLENIKTILDMDTAPTDAATDVIEEYNRKSSFSPSHLFPGKEEDEMAEIPGIKSSTSFPRKVSGELIPGYTGVNGAGRERAVSPNPLSPRRLKEEIERCTPSGGGDDTISLSTSLSSSHPEKSPLPTHSFLLDESCDKASLINQFLADNPHYLKKISDSLSCASLPSFPASLTHSSPEAVPPPASGGAQDDIKTVQRSPPVTSKPRSPPAGVVSKGAVTQNIAKFERKREEMEAEIQRDRSVSPKRTPKQTLPKKKRSGGGGGGSPGKSPVSTSPEPRRSRNRVSWEDDHPAVNNQGDEIQEPQVAVPYVTAAAPTADNEIVMKPDKKSVVAKRPAKSEVTAIKTGASPNDGPGPKAGPTNGPNNGPKQEPSNGPNNGGPKPGPSSNGAHDIKSTVVDSKSEKGGDLMAQLMTLNDEKLTQLVTTLNQLTER